MKSWRFRRRLYGKHTVRRSHVYSFIGLVANMLLCVFLALWLVFSILILFGVM